MPYCMKPTVTKGGADNDASGRLDEASNELTSAAAAKRMIMFTITDSTSQAADVARTLAGGSRWLSGNGIIRLLSNVHGCGVSPSNHL